MSLTPKPISAKRSAGDQTQGSSETEPLRDAMLQHLVERLVEKMDATGETAGDSRRRSVVTTFKALSELGYTVVPTQDGNGAQNGAVTDGLDQLKREKKNVHGLLQLWRNRPKNLWSKSLSFYTLAADYLCQHSEAFVAVDVCQEGLKYFPGEVRLIQLKAWALAQSGATGKAQELLEELERQSNGGTETWGLLARTWKDMAAAESDLRRKRELLGTSLRYYEKGYEHSVLVSTPDYYPAINCATLLARMGEKEKAREWAECARRLAADESPRGVWAEATLAEAALILGQRAEASQHYRAFALECGSQRAVIGSARRQAVEILGSAQSAREFLAECLPLPPVYALASEAKTAIEKSAAAVLCPWTPADAAAVNALLEQGSEIHLILPFPVETYATNHLKISPEQIVEWRQRAASITLAHPLGSKITADLASFCAFLQIGRARRLAETWSTELCFPRPVEILRGDEVRDAYQTTALAFHEGQASAAGAFSPRCMAFADVVGYGQLNEPQVTHFQQTIMPQIAEFFRKADGPPLFVQTWGDAFYLGFQSVREGGLAALALRSFFANVPWRDLGYNKPLKLRLALHSGPVLTATDPFNGNLYFTGTVVSRAARIEPLTDEDQIFCSDAFSAVASALRLRDFTLTFAGTYLLPKNAGEEALFRLAPPVESSR